MAGESSDEEIEPSVFGLLDIGYVAVDLDVGEALDEHLAAGLVLLAEPERLEAGGFDPNIEPTGAGEEGGIATCHLSRSRG